jgi:hypothetical protein
MTPLENVVFIPQGLSTALDGFTLLAFAGLAADVLG